MNNDETANIEISKEWKNRGDFLKLITTGQIPDHIVVSSVRVRPLKLPNLQSKEGAAGQHASHDNYIILYGECDFYRDKKRDANNPGCPKCSTKFSAGINYRQL